MDASDHDWVEGRGEPMVLSVLIDDATNWIEAGFYAAETTTSYFDLFGRWLRRHGRPLALYTDCDSIFEAHSKGRPDYAGQTQFGRALEELAIELILAHSPQAKGRVERFFELAQDRWVKELRLAGAATRAEANALLRARLQPEYNRRFTVAARERRDAHRALGPGHQLAAILSVQARRVVANDYTIRLANRFYQLEPPVWPGERGGTVVVEQRLDGTMAIRFRGKYLKYQPIAPGGEGAFSALAADARGEEEDPVPGGETGSSGIQPAAGRSGRTPAEPYPSDGATKDTPKKPYRPAENHPWRQGFRRKKC